MKGSGDGPPVLDALSAGEGRAFVVSFRFRVGVLLMIRAEAVQPHAQPAKLSSVQVEILPRVGAA